MPPKSFCFFFFLALIYRTPEYPDEKNAVFSELCVRLIYITFFLGGGARSLLGEGNGTPLQYSCLENPMDGEAWWAVVHGVAKSWTRLNDFTLTFHFHALEKEMATHSSVLAWRIPRNGGAW